MELRHLRYFVAVADAGGFARAALQLHITQPALWRQVRDLETELGLRLFERVGRRVRLTREGAGLLRPGRDVLTDVESLGERATVLKTGRAGTIDVGATPMALESVLAGFVTAWSRHHPKIEVRLTEGSGSRLLDQLERSELQLAMTVPDRRFQNHLLFPVGVLAVVPNGHRLSARKSVDAKDLTDEPLLLLRNDFISRRWFDAACEVAHVRPRVRLESAAPQTLITLARRGFGIAVVPTPTRVERVGVSAAPICYRGKPVGGWMAINWNRRRFLPPHAERFIDALVRSTARSYPGREFRLAQRVPRTGQLGAK